MKKYLLLLLAMLCVGGSTGCATKQANQTKQNAAVSQSDSGGENDNSKADEDGEENKKTKATPIPIHVMDSAKEISVTKTDLTDIVLSEEDEYVQVNNNIINGNFIHPYQGGYFYTVEKGDKDGPDEVTVYDDGQGQLTDRSDLSDYNYILHISGDSFYYWGGDGLKQQTGSESKTIISDTIGDFDKIFLAKDGIYYAQAGDEENKTTYLGMVDYQGKTNRRLYTLDVDVSQIYFYRDALWFVFREFDDEDAVNLLGKLNFSDQEISIYHLNGKQIGNFEGDIISIQNEYVYFNASGLKRLNIQNNTVEQVYPKNVEWINFVEDSILFARNRTLYRMNQDGVTKILKLGKNYGETAGIGGIRVEDQKVYLKFYEGAFYDCIDQIDLSGKIKKKIYKGQRYDELVG